MLSEFKIPRASVMANGVSAKCILTRGMHRKIRSIHVEHSIGLHGSGRLHFTLGRFNPVFS